MRLKWFPVLLFFTVTITNAQYNISGSDNLIDAIGKGMNSIPYLQVNGVSGNFKYGFFTTNRGVIFTIEGQGTINTLNVTMPDGKVFNYNWNGKDGFECNDLPRDRTSLSRIGGNAVNLIPTQATALGNTLISEHTEGVVSFTYDSRPYSGLLPTEKLSNYGTVKNKDGNFTFVGNAKDVENLIAISPYLSVTFSGLSPNSESGYRRSVENVRRAYSEWKNLQAAQENRASNNSSSLSASGPVLSSSSPSPTQASKTSTTSQSNSTVSSQNAPSSNRTSNDIYDKAERAGKTLQQMEYERQAYQRQEQERLQQATNPGGYYMEKSGLNAYFDAQHERLNREAAEKEAREEREWLARKRIEEREARDRERKAEEWRKKVQNELKDRKEKRLANYNAKGGEANYRLKLNQWRSFAANEIKQINTFLNRYRGQGVTFTFPENNCHYVQAIEHIQNSTMPTEYKDVLIRNVLRVRYEYHRFYMDNAYISENWMTDGDDLYHSPTYAPCGNFLDIMALGLNKGDVYKSYTYFQNGRGIGAMDDERKIVDETNTSGRNYSIPMGAYPLAVSFKEDVKSAGLNIRERELSYLLHLDGRSDVMNYQENPYNWSEGIGYRNMKEAPRGYADGMNYTSKILWNNPTAIQSEINKFNAVYDVKRKFRLNTVKEELMMTYFNYHTGDMTTSYKHFQRYLFWRYGGFYPFLEHLKHLNNQLKTFTEGDVEEFFIENGKNSAKSHLGIAFVSLLIEKGEYTHALELVDELDKNPSKFFLGTGADTGLDSFRAGLQKLRNIIYFETEQYGKMALPKNESEIKAKREKADDLFKFVPNKVYNRDREGDIKENQRLKKQLPIDKVRYLNHDDPHLQALALVQLGNKKLAKAVLEDMVSYYAKHNSKSPRLFLGSSTDIAAMKEAMHLLYPSQEGKIQYKLAGERLLHHYLDYAWNAHRDHLYGMGRYFLPHDLKAPTYISKETVDLENLQEWTTLKTRLQSHDGSKNAIQELYNGLVKIHETGHFKKNEEAKNFLTSYIQLGIALGKFQEIIPVIVDKDMMFPKDKSTLLEKNLCYLMWPQSKSIFQAKEFQSGLNESISSSVLDYFEKEVKNNGAFKSSLQTYVSIWARDKVSSPMIPYLYHTLAEDGETTPDSNQRNGVQTTSPDGYIQTSSGLKYNITKAVYSGNTVKDGETHFYHYICKLTDGTIVDNSYSSGPPYMSIIEKGRFLPGFYEALKLLKPGEKGSFILPPNLAYGSAGRGKIPPKATLLYEIEVLNNKKQ